MELGNLIFGNSRGEASIPRTKDFEKPWDKLCKKLKLNWYGFEDDGCLIPEKDGVLQNEVFAVRSYDWNAECDCGADAKFDEWSGKNSHSDACYQSVYYARMAAYDADTKFKDIEQAAYAKDPMAPEMEIEEVSPGINVVSFSSGLNGTESEALRVLAKARELRDAFEEETRRALCAERGLSFPEGSMVHCDCGLTERSEQYWTEIGGHSESCRLIQPNFLYKPTGFRISWYKYPFRDSYMTPEISPAEWRKIVNHCIRSVLTPSQPQSTDS